MKMLYTMMSSIEQQYHAFTYTVYTYTIYIYIYIYIYIGMKKHTLDRRFNSAENLQQRTSRRGAKRSKRAPRGEA